MGKITGELTFSDQSALNFIEFVDTTTGVVLKHKYSYHYQLNTQLIFRYDNAPHHHELSTFPHHKHFITNGEDVKESNEVDLIIVLNEIVQLILYQSRSAP